MANASETITIGDRVYTVLFPDLVRPLTERERQDLKSSIERYGIKQEVVVDEEGNGIIDGANRAQIAAELGLPIPTRLVETKNEEEKRRLALELNTNRRHLLPEERTKLMEERKQRVKESRAEGKSLRAIAEEEGVSEKQVRKDLAASPADQSAPGEEKQSPIRNESEMTAVDTSTSNSPSQPPSQTDTPSPMVVKGLDGKSYPSRRRGNRSSRNKPKKCNIRGLVKPIKDLVVEGKVDEWLAKGFAEKLDREKQKQFIDGKDAEGIIAALKNWDKERRLIAKAEGLFSEWGSVHAFEEWQPAKASPECRQQVLARLCKARDALDRIIAIAQQQPALAG